MRAGGGTPSLDPDAAAYISAVETADGEALEEGVKTAINDFVSGCKSDAIWDAIKASCIMAGARTISGALVPLVGDAPTNVNFVSADYDRKTGLKGDGSTKYLSSNRNNNADPQNSQHLAVFVTEQFDLTGGGNYGYIGSSTSFSGHSLVGRSGSSANALFARSRRGGASLISLNSSSPIGFHGKTRSLGSGFTGRVLGTNTNVSSTSVVPSTDKIAIFSWGVPITNPAGQRLSFYSIGESLDLSALDARVSALMTALDGAIA
jgi:hypothetical protein